MWMRVNIILTISRKGMESHSRFNITHIWLIFSAGYDTLMRWWYCLKRCQFLTIHSGVLCWVYAKHGIMTNLGNWLLKRQYNLMILMSLYAYMNMYATTSMQKGWRKNEVDITRVKHIIADNCGHNVWFDVILIHTNEWTIFLINVKKYVCHARLCLGTKFEVIRVRYTNEIGIILHELISMPRIWHNILMNMMWRARKIGLIVVTTLQT